MLRQRRGCAAGGPAHVLAAAAAARRHVAAPRCAVAAGGRAIHRDCDAAALPALHGVRHLPGPIPLGTIFMNSNGILKDLSS